MEALLRGVSDGQDILTMSLGGANGWTESTSSVVSSRIAASGKIVTIAAGNDVSSVTANVVLFTIIQPLLSGILWFFLYFKSRQCYQRYLCSQS